MEPWKNRECENCGEKSHGRLCSWCSKKRRELGRLPDVSGGRVCCWPGCDDRQRKFDRRWSGYCEPHYGWAVSRARMKMSFDDFEELMSQDEPRVIGSTGYARVHIDGRWVQEHLHVMQEKLGRPLLKGENVHHVNGVRHDNSPDNLELWVVAQPAGQRAEQVNCPHCGEPWEMTA